MNKYKIIDVKTGKVSYGQSEVKESEQPAYIPTRADYEHLVDQKVRQRYSPSQELAILRQKDEKPEEWQTYYEYCEQCKTEAKEELGL